MFFKFPDKGLIEKLTDRNKVIDCLLAGFLFVFVFKIADGQMVD